MGTFRIKLISTMNHSNDYDTYVNSFLSKTFNFFNNRFLRKKGMASTLKMEYQVFPKEFSYGYLRFEGNGKISLGR